jgi:hypothetical protein
LAVRVNMLWIAGGVGVIAALAAILRTWQRREHSDDMGSVSHQWISEQRLGQQGPDARR